MTEAVSPEELASKAEAEEAKTRGDARFRERKYAEAIAAYDESYRIHPDARVLYNKGRAFEALGEHGAALESLLAFQREASAELRARVEGLDSLISAQRQRVCELSVVVDVEGAEVRLGDRILGTAPLAEKILVNAGSTKLVVRKEGYFTSSRDVALPGGGVASFDVTLKSKATNAKLSIASSVIGTLVSVDGRPLGNAPTEIVLAPGTHAVLARHEGHHDASMQVVLVAGQDRSIVLDPEEKKRALYQEWWFWGGVGVVLAGAAAAAFVLSNQPEPSDGDFSPSAISAPLVRY